jgi:hypothetical protein
MFLIALIRVKTINLTEIATGFRSEAKINSNYKRLQRFFSKFNPDSPQIARFQINSKVDEHSTTVDFKLRPH